MTNDTSAGDDVSPPRRPVVIPWVAIFQLRGEAWFYVELHVPRWFSGSETAILFTWN